MTSKNFSVSCEKNAVRRQGLLPLIDVREEMRVLDFVDNNRDYVKIVDEHDDDRQRIYREVLAEKRAVYGDDYGISAGGRNFVALVAHKRFEAFLTAKGIRKPTHPGRPTKVTAPL